MKRTFITFTFVIIAMLSFAQSVNFKTVFVPKTWVECGQYYKEPGTRGMLLEYNNITNFLHVRVVERSSINSDKWKYTSRPILIKNVVYISAPDNKGYIHSFVDKSTGDIIITIMSKIKTIKSGVSNVDIINSEL